jgi:DNA-binding transcriptional LysR family regulator
VQAERFTIAFATGVTLTKWTSAWQERHPAIALGFVPTTPETQVTALHRLEADVSFVRLPILQGGLSVIPLYEENAVVVLPKDHRLADLDAVTLADLEGEDVRAPTLDAVELVAVGGGIVILPQSIARLAPRKDVVVRPVSDAPATRIAIAWREDRTTPEVEEFVGIVRGRTANSSRSAQEAPEPVAKAKKPVQAKAKAKVITGRTRPRKPRRR